MDMKLGSTSSAQAHAMNVIRAEGLSALVIMTANFWNMTQADTTLRTWIGLNEINLILSH